MTTERRNPAHKDQTVHGLVDFKGRTEAEVPSWLRPNTDTYTHSGGNAHRSGGGDRLSATESAQ